METSTSPSMDRHAAEWGLASLILGGVLALMALVTLLLNIFIGSLARNLMNAAEVRLALNASFIALGVIFFVTLFAIFSGIKGVFSAQSRQQPAALPVAGVLLGLLALMIWIIAGFDLIAILSMLARIAPAPAA